jgi:hypothetical protein
MVDTKNRIGALVSAIVMTSFAQGAYAGPLAPTKASDTVTLLGGFSSPACISGSSAKQVDVRQKSDGTTGPFTVPPKSVFVITSYEFITQSAIPSKNVVAGLAVADATLTGSSIVNLATALADSSGTAGGSVLLPSGFPVKSGARLCFQFVPDTNGSVTVHGFLAKDK